MLQRDIEKDTLPWCRERGIAVCVYWPLLKGLLAGKLPRDHVFRPGDGRAKYPMFQGDEWQKNQDFLDELRAIAADTGKTVAQVVINWTIQQPGITVALCGAKRPDQIRDTAAALGWRLSAEHMAQIAQALARRGQPVNCAGRCSALRRYDLIHCQIIVELLELQTQRRLYANRPKTCEPGRRLHYVSREASLE